MRETITKDELLDFFDKGTGKGASLILKNDKAIICDCIITAISSSDLIIINRNFRLLQFKDVVFSGPLHLCAHDVASQNESVTEEIIISNCETKFPISITGETKPNKLNQESHIDSFPLNIEFIDCPALHNIVIGRLHCNNIRFHNSTVNTILVSHSKVCHDVSLQKMIVKGSTEFHEIESVSCLDIFDNCEFNKDIEIISVYIRNKLTIASLSKANLIHVSDLNIKLPNSTSSNNDDLEIDNEEDLHTQIGGAEIILDSSSPKVFRVNGQFNIRRLSLLPTSPLLFTCEASSNSDIEEEKKKISDINFFNCILPKDSVINIRNTRIDKILFEDFTNQGKIVFNDISYLSNTPNDEGKRREQGISFIQSDMGQTFFLNCRLNESSVSENHEFLNSKIYDMFIASSLFPQKISLPNRSDIEKNKRDELNQQRLYYSQLKKIYQNQGNLIESSAYSSYEQQSHLRRLIKNISFNNVKAYIKYRQTNQTLARSRELLFGIIRIWNKIKSLFFDINDILILSLNRISTLHGKSWLFGVVFLLLISMLLFFAYYQILSPLYFDSYQTNRHFAVIVGYFFLFINPLHPTDFMKELLNGKQIYDFPGAVALDYFSKIIISYFIYQIIQAFRKFSRNS